jgi:hypothetical protein
VRTALDSNPTSQAGAIAYSIGLAWRSTWINGGQNSNDRFWIFWISGRHISPLVAERSVSADNVKKVEQTVEQYSIFVERGYAPTLQQTHLH